MWHELFFVPFLEVEVVKLKQLLCGSLCMLLLFVILLLKTSGNKPGNWSVWFKSTFCVVLAGLSTLLYHRKILNCVCMCTPSSPANPYCIRGPESRPDRVQSLSMPIASDTGSICKERKNQKRNTNELCSMCTWRALFGCGPDELFRQRSSGGTQSTYDPTGRVPTRIDQ